MSATQNLHKPPLMAKTPLKNPRRLVSELGLPPPQNLASPTSKYLQFLLKGSLFAIVIAILPFLPSQAPDFINKTLITRAWELLHLVFVGIAVSYGFLSRCNTEAEKENQVSSQIEITQSYVSKILQVSSVFDEELEILTVSNDYSNVQIWNSQYFPRESVVTTMNGDRSANCNNRPLFLPIRSLKSGLSDSNSVSEFDDLQNSKLNSPVKILEEKSKNETLVFPSPIPWTSRSGRMEVKEEQLGSGFPQISVPLAVDEAEIYHGIHGLHFRSSTPLSSRPSSASSPSPKLSPTSTLSPELRAKSVEDYWKKKHFHRSGDEFSLEEELGKSYRLESFSEKRERKISREEGEIGRNFRSESFSVKKERRLTREEEEFVRSFRSKSFPDKKESNRSSNRSKRIPPNPEDQSNSSSTMKSVRRIRSREIGKALIQERRKSSENSEKKTYTEPESVMVEKPGRHAPMSLTKTDKWSREIPRSLPSPDFSEEPEEESNRQNVKESLENSIGDAVDNGEDEVDKKADVFIAKFREHIRLQRIDSIEIPTGNVAP